MFGGGIRMSVPYVCASAAERGIIRSHSPSTMKVAQLRFRLVVGVTTVIVAVGYAFAYVAHHDWFGVGDLIAMTTWSLPLAFGIAGFMPALSGRISRFSAPLSYSVFAASGVMLGFLWAVLVALVLGGWIAAFSFPVLWCWVVGGFFGGLAAGWMIHPRSWTVAAVLIVLASVAIVRINNYASEPERAIRVVIKADANAEEVDSVWMDVLGRRTGRGAEHAILPSLSSVSAEPKEGNRHRRLRPEHHR